MQPILSVNEEREAEASAVRRGVSGRELMRRAATGVYNAVKWRPPVAVVCGSGNNAGDGYALALLLMEHGIACSIFRTSDRFSDDGRYYYSLCEEKRIPVYMYNGETKWEEYGTIVDCIFGIGFHGSPDERTAGIMDRINASRAMVVSVDINSGLNSDSGSGDRYIVSDLTVSIGSWKRGHFLNAAKDAIKDKINVDIGMPPENSRACLFEGCDAAGLFPDRKNMSNKGTYGYLALIGGSARYPGAVRLAGMANCAMRAGAGVVRIAAPGGVCRALMPEVLEATLFPLSEKNGALRFVETEFEELTRGMRVIAFGMGITCTAETRRAVEYLLKEYDGTLIIDADGLNALSGTDDKTISDRNCGLILTPHPGEFSRLTGKTVNELLSDPVGEAEGYAAAHGAVVLLKGPTTVVTDGTRTLFIDRGCPGMATAGSGDVLSGIIAAVCAGAGRGDPVAAAAAAAYLNGLAGEIAEKKYGDVSMLAGDTADAIPAAVAALRKGSFTVGQKRRRVSGEEIR